MKYVGAHVSAAGGVQNAPQRAAEVVHGGHFPSFDGARLRALIREFLDEHAPSATARGAS